MGMTMAGILRIAFLGCKPGGIAEYHAVEFQQAGCTIAGCCDVLAENARTFAARYQIPSVYTDPDEMMTRECPDILVICTPHHMHAPNVLSAAVHRPRAILVEKPIALTLAEADGMIAACQAVGTRLIVGHQRRYGAQYARAKELLDAGAVGSPVRVEGHGHHGSALYADGTHTIDLMRFYLGDRPAQWVMGQIDYRSKRVAWGSYVEDAALALFSFQDGVRGLLTTGGQFLSGERNPPFPGGGTPFATDAMFSYHQLVIQGTEGVIEVNGDPHWEADFPILRVRSGGKIMELRFEQLLVENDGSRWHRGLSPQQDLVDCLRTGREHPLNGNSARATLELLLAIMESSRRRGLVELPLDIGDAPLFDLIEREKGETFS